MGDWDREVRKSTSLGKVPEVSELMTRLKESD